jgi:hypothetical protein
MGFRCLLVEDLQNGRELERSTRFATRNRKNRVNIGLPRYAAVVGSAFNQLCASKVLSQFDDSHFCNIAVVRKSVFVQQSSK